MNSYKILKLGILNISLAVANIILFSPGIIGLGFVGESTFIIAFSCTVVFLDIAIFFYGNFSIITKKPGVISVKQLTEPDDIENALKFHKGNKIFEKDIQIILEQLVRFEKKKRTLQDILSQEFDIGQMTYKKFDGVILNVEKILYMNNKSIINKISVFDEEDYSSMKKNKSNPTFSQDLVNDKLNVYEEYIKFVSEAVEDNEELLLKLDKLLLEISKLDSIEGDEIENMPEIREFDELINNTKYYK